MKVLTAAAALAVFSPDHRFATTVVQGRRARIGGARRRRRPHALAHAERQRDRLPRRRAPRRARPAGARRVEGRSGRTRRSRSSCSTARSSAASLARQLGPGRARARLHVVVTALMVDGDRQDPYAEHVGAQRRSRRPRRPSVRRRAGVGAIERGTAPSGAASSGGSGRRPWRSSSTSRSWCRTTPRPRCSPVSSRSRRARATRSPRSTRRSGRRSRRTASTRGGIASSTARALARQRGAAGVPHAAVREGRRPRGQPRRAHRRAARSRGRRGSLSYADRFAGDNAVAAGAVLGQDRLDHYGLHAPGVIRAQDGATLTFAIYALGDVTDAAKQAIDALATGFSAAVTTSPTADRASDRGPRRPPDFATEWNGRRTEPPGPAERRSRS